ncbi:kpsM protein [Methylolobus aquaticus]|nr:kpsM protein [Methylolobus aquaticus]
MQHRTSWQIQKAVLSALLLRELKSRFGRHRVGILRVLVEPLLHLTGIMLIFWFIRDRGQIIIDVPVFLLVGLVPFLLFKNTALRTMDGFRAEKGVLVYRQVKPLDIFLSRIIIEFTIAIWSYVTILVVLGWWGYDIVPNNLLALIALLVGVIPLGFGLGLLLHVLCRIAPEMRIFVRLAFMPLYFLSGIIHPLYIVPKAVADFLLWNPILRIVELSRHSFFENYPMPYTVGSFYVVMVTIGIFFVGLRAFRVRTQSLEA